MKRAVVLLSGGLDSATTLAICRDSGFEPYALSFDYGQRHKLELAAAKHVAASLGAHEHRIGSGVDQVPAELLVGHLATQPRPTLDQSQIHAVTKMAVNVVRRRQTTDATADDHDLGSRLHPAPPQTQA